MGEALPEVPQCAVTRHSIGLFCSKPHAHRTAIAPPCRGASSASLQVRGTATPEQTWAAALCMEPPSSSVRNTAGAVSCSTANSNAPMCGFKLSVLAPAMAMSCLKRPLAPPGWLPSTAGVHRCSTSSSAWCCAAAAAAAGSGARAARWRSLGRPSRKCSATSSGRLSRWLLRADSGARAAPKVAAAIPPAAQAGTFSMLRVSCSSSAGHSGCTCQRLLQAAFLASAFRLSISVHRQIPHHAGHVRRDRAELASGTGRGVTCLDGLHPCWQQHRPRSS